MNRLVVQQIAWRSRCTLTCLALHVLCLFGRATGRNARCSPLKMKIWSNSHSRLPTVFPAHNAVTANSADIASNSSRKCLVIEKERQATTVLWLYPTINCDCNRNRNAWLPPKNKTIPRSHLSRHEISNTLLPRLSPGPKAPVIVARCPGPACHTRPSDRATAWQRQHSRGSRHWARPASS